MIVYAGGMEEEEEREIDRQTDEGEERDRK